jgi:hypothetical protein
VKEHARIAGLLTTPGLLVAQVRIERDVLVHELMRVEPDFAETAPPRFLLGEGHQRTADAPALVRRIDRDVVEQHMIVVLQQHDQAQDRLAFSHDPDGALGHTRAIVVEHRAGLLADAFDIFDVGVVHDALDRRQIVRLRETD